MPTKPKKRRIAIFGGSFNPPHMGHVLATQYLLSTQAVDAVWWLPCWQHAFDKRLLPFATRLQLCRLSTASLPRQKVRVSDFESRIKAQGRTLEVLTALSAHYPQDRFILVVGSDILRQARRWYKFNTILRRFGILVVPRGGKAGIPNISSTQIRQQLQVGRLQKGLVPALIEPKLVRIYRRSKLR